MRFFSILFLISIIWISEVQGDIILLTSRELVLIPVVSILVTGILTFGGIAFYFWKGNKKNKKMVQVAEAPPEKAEVDQSVNRDTLKENSTSKNEPDFMNQIAFQPVVESQLAPPSTDLRSLPVEPAAGGKSKENPFKKSARTKAQ